MTLKEALSKLKQSAFSNEVIEQYAPCKEGFLFITKSNYDSEDLLDDDDLIIGDFIYILVRHDGKVELTIPPDVDFNEEDIEPID